VTIEKFPLEIIILLKTELWCFFSGKRSRNIPAFTSGSLGRGSANNTLLQAIENYG
jgi:hypothetical protein